MGSPKVTVPLRLPEEDVEFLRGEVARIGPAKTNISLEIHKAVTQRRISLLPKWQREDLYKKLALAKENQERTLFDEPEKKPAPAEGETNGDGT